jgi:hypothetical protein
MQIWPPQKPKSRGIFGKIHRPFGHFKNVKTLIINTITILKRAKIYRPSFYL